MNYSLYIHIPFCRHRCAYCDFNTYAGQEAGIPAYVEAVGREIEFVAAQMQDSTGVHTVFFGGGTPSLLSADELTTLLSAIRRNFRVEADAEITMEANPGSVSFEALVQLRAAGINRISFGAQSANGEELRILERTHTFLDVLDAVTAARRAGFNNLNLDLIYGLPEQQLETWKTTVRRVLDMCPEHVSAYALTLEHGTPFGRWAARGMLPIPDPDAAAEMYEWAGEYLEASGYMQYEISNWGKTVDAGHMAADGAKAEATGETPHAGEVPAYACRHNLQYWRCLPYLGFGAGAHGYAGGYRYSNALRIKTYLERIASGQIGHRQANNALRAAASLNQGKARTPEFPLSPAAVNQHRQTMADEMSEFMITGLRLTREGVKPTEFRKRFGQDLVQAYGPEIDDLVNAGLLESVEYDASGATGAARVIRLTKRGRLLGNQVFLRFV